MTPGIFNESIFNEDIFNTDVEVLAPSDDRGVFLIPWLRVTGRARLTATPAIVVAKGTARIVGRSAVLAPAVRCSARAFLRGRVRCLAPAVRCSAAGVLRLRGAVALSSSRGECSAVGAVANPGEWAIVIEAEGDEAYAVITTGGQS